MLTKITADKQLSFTYVFQNHLMFSYVLKYVIFYAVHRDLKPTNILLTRLSQNTVVAKLTDFGLSREIPDGLSSLNSLSVGTTSYMAKECYELRWVIKESDDVFLMLIC